MSFQFFVKVNSPLERFKLNNTTFLMEGGKDMCWNLKLTFFTIPAAITCLALTNIIKPVIHTFPAIFAQTIRTLATSRTAVRNASGIFG